MVGHPHGDLYALIGHDQFGASGSRWQGSMPRALGLVALSPFVSRLPLSRTLKQAEDHLAVLKEFTEAGKITPVIAV